MREIKFRGKRLDNGKFVYGFYIKYKHMGDVRHIIVTEYPQIYANSYEVDPETVGQYRGKDQRGADLYEGDIYKYEDVNEYPSHIERKIIKKIVPSIRNSVNGFGKRIGNIHDNPELLAGG